jgi:hypothetical protein
MSRASGAIANLEAKLITASDAAEHLRTVASLLGMLALYSKFFPVEFAKEPIRWSKRNTVTGACERFTELVSAHLFPCAELWDFDERFGDGLHLEIVFHAPWPAWYEMDYREDLSVLEEVILLNQGYIRAVGDSWEHVPDMRTALSLNAEKLDALCKKERGPLRYLPVAVNFVFKTTGNIWCDIAQEELDHCGDWPEWSEENIEFYAKEWKQAQAIHAGFYRLLLWMQGPPARRKRVERLLRQCLVERKRARIRIGTTSEFLAGDRSAPLVDQMDDWGIEDDV